MTRIINLNGTIYQNGSAIISKALNDDAIAIEETEAAIIALQALAVTLQSNIDTLENTVTTLTGRVTALETAEGTQKEVITLSGAGGTATIAAAGGLTKVLSFITSLTATAAAFVVTNAAAYAVENIVLTSDGDDLVFISNYAGIEFTSPTITTIVSDSDGSVVNTTPNGAGTAQVDTLTVSGADGKVTVTGAGGLSKDIEFDTSLTGTTDAFVAAYAAEYLTQDIVVTNSVADLIFTSNIAGTAFTSPVKTQVVGDLDGTEVATQINVVTLPQIDTVTLSGSSGAIIITGTGGFTNSVTYNTSPTQTAADFATNQASDYATINITVTSSGADIIFTADDDNTPFTSPISSTDWGDLAGSVANTQVAIPAVAQIDTVTLDTGTDGEASMTAVGGLTSEVRWDTDYETTASNFVTDHSAAYTAQAITVTSSGDDIIFTANVAGTGFTNAIIANVAWDLDGSVVNTQANVARVAQIDTITVTGTAGQFTIGAAGGLSKIGEFNSTLTLTCEDFVTNFAVVYAAEGIAVTSSVDDLIFTASTAGTSFTSPTITTLVSDLDGIVVDSII